ncbi:L-gulonolactone oxidase 2-like [Impatiens glandulifera]|uniref:L-gulonolactone oxidase 2-like n=1 Tax=Impatiens glandulifera TaxID=253017 RepID=UPI001FB0C99A|nr:L-gulonolactone oxidase 2-like [Impatiens glandulifera]
MEIGKQFLLSLKLAFIALNTITNTNLYVHATPPQDPVKCSSNINTCTITNAYGMFPDRSICRVADVAYPKTEEELVSVVAEASKNGRKMRVATPTSHSIPKLVCPDNGDGGLLISTRFLNRVIEIDKTRMILTAESGVLLKDLINEAAKVGLALPYSPYWWGVTVGGMLATGSHGSTLWGRGGAVHDHVVGLRIVTLAGPEEGYAKVRTLVSSEITAAVGNSSVDGEEQSGGFDAARTSLGVLGVVSQVTFQLQPMFKRSITFQMKNDNDLGDQIVNFGYQHEFADIAWYPSQRKVVYRLDDRISSSVFGNGLYNFIPFRPTLSLLTASIRASEEIQEYLGDANGKCLVGIASTTALYLSAYGLTNDGVSMKGYPVIGYQNRMQASGGCLDGPNDFKLTTCPWDPRIKGLSFYELGVSIVMSKVKAFVEDVQSLVNLDPKALCVLDLYNGFLIRYVKASTSYLGKDEDGVQFDFTFYRSKNPLTTRLYEDVLEEVEQMALFKYGGMPHWAKNRPIAFIDAINKYRNAAAFLAVKQEWDPLGLFSNEWTDQVLKGGDHVSIVKEGCALEGLCICSEDIHCAPMSGYYCRPGRIYKEARVCRKTMV